MQRAPLGKAQALGSLCARPQAAAVWRVPVLWATLLGVSVLWCVGALAPWFAQGAGQGRQQAGVAGPSDGAFAVLREEESAKSGDEFPD